MLTARIRFGRISVVLSAATAADLARKICRDELWLALVALSVE